MFIGNDIKFKDEIIEALPLSAKQEIVKTVAVNTLKNVADMIEEGSYHLIPTEESSAGDGMGTEAEFLDFECSWFAKGVNQDHCDLGAVLSYLKHKEEDYEDE